MTTPHERGFTGYSEEPRISHQRSVEDSIRVTNRDEFRKEHGREARTLLSGDRPVSKHLTGLTRGQKRAFYRSAIDFAVVEMTGETFAEEHLKIPRVGQRAQDRLKASGLNENQVVALTNLAKTASQTIVATYRK